MSERFAPGLWLTIALVNLTLVDLFVYYTLRVPLSAAPLFLGSVLSAFFLGRASGIHSVRRNLRIVRNGRELFITKVEDA
jgi:hypothetical protein